MRKCLLPCGRSSTNAANSRGAQDAYESVLSLWSAIKGGGKLIGRAAGWMESGLVASLEKLALDSDLLQMVTRVLQPVTVDDVTMALDAIREVGPGGHFFGAQHTLAPYSTALKDPLISDWRNHGQWVAAV